MLIATSSQKKNDCVIVAISTALCKPYSEVEQELSKLSTREKLISRTGIEHSVWTEYLKQNGWIECKSIPRRGQEKINGIVRVISSKYVSGHLVYMKDGIVYDKDFPSGIGIKEYQRRTSKRHINMIWIKRPEVIVKKDTEFIPFNPDSLFK